MQERLYAVYSLFTHSSLNASTVWEVIHILCAVHVLQEEIVCEHKLLICMYVATHEKIISPLILVFLL